MTPALQHPCPRCHAAEQASGSFYCGRCHDDNERAQAAHRERATLRLIRDAPKHTSDTWKTYEIDDDNRAAVEQAVDWRNSERDYSGGIYLHGPVGTGKTHLAFLLAKEYIYGGYDETARLVVVRNLLAEARAAMTQGRTSPVDILLAEEISVLVLDDLGAERPTDWSLETIAAIVETRYLQTYQPIIVTSNYAPGELAAKYAKVDPIAAQRIVSRLVENTLVLELPGADRRLYREAA